MIESSRLNEIFEDCLFEEKEIENGIPIYEEKFVDGIVAIYGFNSNKILKHKEEISSMLDEMDITFKKGWSFLNLCFDKDGNQWTGSHLTMEQLMCLGMAIGRVSYCTIDRDMWTVLPGGMPYIEIK